MQESQFSDYSHLLNHLGELNQRIETLKFISKHLKGVSVKIEITFDTGDRCELDQRLIPFNLEMELRNIIGDSIDEWQRQVVNLSTIANNERN